MKNAVNKLIHVRLKRQNNSSECIYKLIHQ